MASAAHGISNRTVLLIAVTLGATSWVLLIGWPQAVCFTSSSLGRALVPSTQRQSEWNQASYNQDSSLLALRPGESCPLILCFISLICRMGIQGRVWSRFARLLRQPASVRLSLTGVLTLSSLPPPARAPPLPFHALYGQHSGVQ